jgi:hypothetical protein
MLPFPQRAIAHHRIALLKSGAMYTQAARKLRAGEGAQARSLFGAAIRRYPPSLLSRSGLGCARRIIFGGARRRPDACAFSSRAAGSAGSVADSKRSPARAPPR